MPHMIQIKLKGPTLQEAWQSSPDVLRYFSQTAKDFNPAKHNASPSYHSSEVAANCPEGYLAPFIVTEPTLSFASASNELWYWRAVYTSYSAFYSVLSAISGRISARSRGIHRVRKVRITHGGTTMRSLLGCCCSNTTLPATLVGWESSPSPTARSTTGWTASYLRLTTLLYQIHSGGGSENRVKISSLHRNASSKPATWSALLTQTSWALLSFERFILRIVRGSTLRLAGPKPLLFPIALRRRRR